ncbi:MAG: antitoxin MazE family protein [Cyanobacteria bacterium]|nr:antitoxin MazE family protein [Cyanobacteriota bacterium]
MDDEVTTGAASMEFRQATNRRTNVKQSLRAQGMRLIEIWVPDVKSKKLAAEARRQARLVAESTEEAEIQSFIDSVFVWPDDAYSQ